ncbi:MAG: hypothetical protein AABX01_05045 [Candidatus Micrarchaeota archaeon]
MERLDKLIAYLKEFGLKPKVDNFESKLIIQKAVCLLELQGAQLGYGYSLYVRGPYSPELTQEMYANKQKIQNLETGSSLTSKEENMAKKIKEFTDLIPSMLEIVATYAYLVKSGLNPSEATTRLRKLKPFYSASQIIMGINRAKELFPPSAKEVDDMLKEFREWDLATSTDLSKWD